jgi:signal transduction histidine kinase
MEAAHPGRRLVLECGGGLRGLWDRDRLAQTVSNLVANALQHGDPRHPVTIQATSGDGTATVTVHNFGKPIAPASLKTIFDPMVRSPQGQDYRPSTNLGLGLFIVREIVTAHGGTVHVTSTADVGTTFAVSLPHEGSVRKPPRSAATSRRTPFRSQSTAT